MSEAGVLSSTHEPDSYGWCLERFRVGNDDRLSVVAQVAAERWTVWPEQLVGRAFAGDAARGVDADPLLAGNGSEGPSRLGHVVLARRVAWNLAHEFTDKSAAEIGAAFGGFSPNTVRPYIRDTVELAVHYGSGIREVIGQLSLRTSLELLGPDDIY